MGTNTWNEESNTRYQRVCSILEILELEKDNLIHEINKLHEEKRAWESLHLSYGKEARQ